MNQIITVPDKGKIHGSADWHNALIIPAAALVQSLPQLICNTSKISDCPQVLRTQRKDIFEVIRLVFIKISAVVLIFQKLSINPGYTCHEQFRRRRKCFLGDV